MLHAACCSLHPVQLWSKVGNSPDTPIPLELSQKLNQWSIELTYVNNFMGVVDATTCIRNGQQVQPFAASIATASAISASDTATQLSIIGGPILVSGTHIGAIPGLHWYAAHALANLHLRTNVVGRKSA